MAVWGVGSGGVGEWRSGGVGEWYGRWVGEVWSMVGRWWRNGVTRHPQIYDWLNIPSSTPSLPPPQSHCQDAGESFFEHILLYTFSMAEATGSLGYSYLIFDIFISSLQSKHLFTNYFLPRIVSV